MKREKRSQPASQGPAGRGAAHWGSQRDTEEAGEQDEHYIHDVDEPRGST